LIYGFCDRPFASQVRLIFDQARMPTDPFVPFGDGGSRDVGFPRSVVRPEGKVVTVYAFHDCAGSVRDIEATI
jgi:hypothetical protein